MYSYFHIEYNTQFRSVMRWHKKFKIWEDFKNNINFIKETSYEEGYGE